MTQISAVLAIGTSMMINTDPEAQLGMIIVFLGLAGLAYLGLFILVRDKMLPVKHPAAGQ